MFPILRALSWEYWNQGKWGFAAGLAGMIGIPAFVYGLLVINGGDVSETQDAIPLLLFTFLSLTCCLCLMSVMRVQADEHFAFPKRFFTLPLRVQALGVWKLGITALTAAAMYLITAKFLNLAFDARWPYLGPTLFFVAVVLCHHAVIWTTCHHSPLRQSSEVALIAGLGVWLLNRFLTDGQMDRTRLWNEVTLKETFVLGSAIVASCGVALVAVTAARKGQYLKLPTTSPAAPARIALLPLAARRSASPGKMLFAFEWRQKGWVLPAVPVVSNLICIAIFALGWIDVKNWFIASVAVFLVQLYVVPFSGIWLGRISSELNKSTNINPFRAVQPVTDRQIAYSVLAAGFSSILLMVAVNVFWITIAAAMYYIIEPASFRSDIVSEFKRLDVSHILVPIVSFFLVGWSIFGLTVTVSLTGRAWLKLSAVLGILFVASVTSPFIVSKVISEAILTALLFGLAVCCAAGTVWAYVAAIRTRLLHWMIALMAFFVWGLIYASVVVYWHELTALLIVIPVCGGAGIVCAYFVAIKTRLLHRMLVLMAYSGWVLICAIVAGYLYEYQDFTRSSSSILVYQLNLLGAFLTLPVFPFAAAPLAVHWNRHR